MSDQRCDLRLCRQRLPALGVFVHPRTAPRRPGDRAGLWTSETIALLLVAKGRDMNQRWLLRLVSTALTVAATTSGCGLVGPYSQCVGDRPDGLKSRDLVGTYRSSSSETVTLNKDGTFTSDGWPAGMGIGSGTWRLNPPGNDVAWPVDFSFPERAFGTGLSIQGSPKNPELYEFVGDPDQCDVVTFR